MFCKNMSILNIDKNNHVHIEHLNNLKSYLDNKNIVKQFLIDKKYYLVPCGKCSVCVESKRNMLNKKVFSAFKQWKYGYLITFTFSNENVDILLNNTVRKQISKNDYSKYSNLSKTKISNIIKNIKNKLNRYYGTKQSLGYFLCGEYGSNTRRAHYHMILFLNNPLPNLTKESVKGNHYKSKLLNSKQFANYDITPVKLDNSKNISKYLTKYLTKQSFTNFKDNSYTRWQEKFINYLKNNEFDFTQQIYIPKTKQDLYNLLIWIFYFNNPKLLFDINLNHYLINFKFVDYQKEFIKCSRRLGISSNVRENIDNGVFNYYYRKKNGINDDYVYWNHKRINNIKKYFGKNSLNPTKISNSNNKDIY